MARLRLIHRPLFEVISTSPVEGTGRESVMRGGGRGFGVKEEEASEQKERGGWNGCATKAMAKPMHDPTQRKQVAAGARGGGGAVAVQEGDTPPLPTQVQPGMSIPTRTTCAGRGSPLSCCPREIRPSQTRRCCG